MMEVDSSDDQLHEITPEAIVAIKHHATLSHDEAIEQLFQLEKQYRSMGDAISIGRILVAIVQLFYEAKMFEQLNEHILSFALKKHLQSEKAIGEMIRECCKFIDEISDRVQKIQLLETLRSVTKGKLYAEIERAQIYCELASIRSDDGDAKEAFKVLEELKLDTVTTLDRKKRFEIILQMMELLITMQDYDKCLIVAKKINKQHLDHSVDYQQLKIRYYQLMIIIDKSESYLNTSRHYQAILDTKIMQSLSEDRRKLLTFSVVYCILAPFNNEKSKMMEHIRKHKHIDEVPLFRQLLQEFITIELIDWYALKSKFKEELISIGIFDLSNQGGLKCWKDLRTATIEHNIKVFATYYQRIYLSHMSEFLDINVDETEKHLCNLIVNKTVKGKIDRLTGIVCFKQKFTSSEFNHKPTSCQQDNVLSDWLNQVSTVMKLVDKTSHLINKELEL